MLSKWIARYRLTQAIKLHENKRWILTHTFGYPGRDISWIEHVENTPDYIWHLVQCEYRAAERLKKLLLKYQ